MCPSTRPVESGQLPSSHDVANQVGQRAPDTRSRDLHLSSLLLGVEHMIRIHIWSRPPAGYPPPWYGPGRSIGPGTWHAFTARSLGYLPPFLPLFPHLIEFLANTIGFYTICKDYDSINQHSHPSTTTPPTPTGGEAGNHDHPRGGGGAAQGCAIYTYITSIESITNLY